MNIILTINVIVAVVFACCYAYQLFFLAVPFTRKQEAHKPEVLHRFAILICARNESAVIADLLQSIQHQSYDQRLITTFVMADNCTDNTAEIARQNGAVVYTRFNKEKVGKGYALEQLLKNIEEDYPQTFDGFFVFDADNVLDCHFVEAMNRTFTDGYEVVTSYRNSKNYGAMPSGLSGSPVTSTTPGCSWAPAAPSPAPGSSSAARSSKAPTAGCSTCSPRTLSSPSTTSSKAGPSASAPTQCSMTSSRPPSASPGGSGCGGPEGSSKCSFSCYDMSMTVMPAFLLTVALIVSYLVVGLSALGGGVGSEITFFQGLYYILQMLAGLYGVLFVVGLFTTITEWENIHTTPAKKVLYTITFPIFMLTYIPISLVALFSRKVQWKPIQHHRADRRVLEAAAAGTKRIQNQ